MLISLHLPKTGGSSFLKALHKHYGSGLTLDNDNPMHLPLEDRNQAVLDAKNGIEKLIPDGIQCIHGHFLPVKYQDYATKHPVQFITWMREPVERLLSHYYFWTQPFDASRVGVLRRKMAEEDWSIERFCLGPEMRSLYQQYLWHFPVENFSFIGITEFYEEDIQYFSDNFLGESLTAYTLNRGRKRKEHADIDPAFRSEIEIYHAEDMELYRYALNKREALRVHRQ